MLLIKNAMPIFYQDFLDTSGFLLPLYHLHFPIWVMLLIKKYYVHFLSRFSWYCWVSSSTIPYLYMYHTFSFCIMLLFNNSSHHGDRLAVRINSNNFFFLCCSSLRNGQNLVWSPCLFQGTHGSFQNVNVGILRFSQSLQMNGAWKLASFGTASEVTSYLILYMDQNSENPGTCWKPGTNIYIFFFTVPTFKTGEERGLISTLHGPYFFNVSTWPNWWTVSVHFSSLPTKRNPTSG